jgi:hypothetical protein
VPLHKELCRIWQYLETFSVSSLGVGAQGTEVRSAGT